VHAALAARGVLVLSRNKGKPLLVLLLPLVLLASNNTHKREETETTTRRDARRGTGRARGATAREVI